MFGYLVRRARRWQALVIVVAMWGAMFAGVVASAPPAAACAGDCGESSLTLNVGRSQIRYGEADTFSAIVFDKSDSCDAGFCDNPTGTVEFSVVGATAPFATAALTEYAEHESVTEQVATSALPAGSPEVIARYVPGGSTPFNRSESSYVVQVAPAPTKITLTQSSDTSLTGESVTLTAKIDPTVAIDYTHGAHRPTGSVLFQDQRGGGAPDIDLGTVPLDGNSVATLPTSELQRGYTYVVAKYQGDGDYARANDVVVVHNVRPAPTTTTVTSSANPSPLGQAVTFTARPRVVSPGGGYPDGTVQFFDGPLKLGAPQPVSYAAASITAVLPTGGPHTITAAYSGSQDYNPSNSAPLTQTVACTRTITGSVGSVDASPTGTTCLSNASVGGHVHVPAGARVTVANSTIGGAFKADNGPAAVTICGSRIGSNLSVTGATGFVLIGDPTEDGCAPNSIAGGVDLTSNRGGLALAGDTVNGGVSVLNNVGPGPGPGHTAPEVEANSIGGRLVCTGNSPVVSNDGRPNSAGGRKGECGAPGF